MVRLHPTEGNKRQGTQLILHETRSELCRIALWDCFGTLSLLLLAIERRVTSRYRGSEISGSHQQGV